MIVLEIAETENNREPDHEERNEVEFLMVRLLNKR